MMKMPPKMGVITPSEKKLLDFLAVPHIKDLRQGVSTVGNPSPQQASLIQVTIPTYTCARCGQETPRNLMGYSRKTGKITDLCKECRRRKLKAAYYTPEKRYVARRSHLWSAYRMRLEDYDALLAAQGGVCAICKTPENVLAGRHGTSMNSLAVDHNHTTGKVRGLLCHRCNTGIGALGEDTERMLAAIAYLKAHTS